MQINNCITSCSLRSLLYYILLLNSFFFIRVKFKLTLLFSDNSYVCIECYDENVLKSKSYAIYCIIIIYS